VNYPSPAYNCLLSRGVAILALILFGTITVWSQQSVVTFSGRVTTQNTGQGIAEVAVVAQGNQTGTRVAITDAKGNYILPFGANTNIRVRAYKTGFFFNPVFANYSSSGGFPLMGTHNRDFSGASVPILIFAQPPILMTEDESLNALVLDGPQHLRDPFLLLNDNYFESDKRTRLKLFLVDLDLFSGETLQIITVEARDPQQKTYILPVEELRKVPGTPWLTQLTVQLASDLTAPNDLQLTVTARGQVSNSAAVRIR
jgi:hypothetical protein